MSGSGVRLATNVLCVKKDGRSLDAKDIARKLSYFQLIELCRRNPILYSHQLTDSLTEIQRAQRDAFLRPAMVRLWKIHKEYQPIAGSTTVNPFCAPDVADERRPRPKEIAQSQEPTADSLDESVGSEVEQEISPYEQDRVVTAAPAEDMLIVAPPGTGKTHVLVDRITHLVTTGLATSPAEQILVLSFTRSAVAEVRRRLILKRAQGAHPDVVYARILTFDSLATRYMMMDRNPDFLNGYDFEERIALFNVLVDEGLPNAIDTLRKVKFLLIDEVQDLTGERAAMVLNMARIVKGGGGSVCFLGDPAQAIYDYNTGTEEAMSSTQFLGKITDGTYGSNPPSRIEFKNYRRFETPAMLEFVTRARAAMGDDALHPDGEQIERLVRELGGKKEIEDISALSSTPGSMAVLTRTNLEAYQIWKMSRAKYPDSELWRGSSGNYWPGWIGRLFLGFKQNTMSMDTARKRWSEHIGPLARIGFEEAIRYLEKEGVVSDDRIDLLQLNYAISNGAPITVRTSNRPSLIVSTIHRSKGLEFDDVLIYQPANNFAGDPDEVRVIYVAATRAKRNLALLGKSPAIKYGARNSKQMHLRTNHFHIKAYPKSLSFGLLVDGADEVDWTDILVEESAEDLNETARILWQEAGGGIPKDATIQRSKNGQLNVMIAGRDVCAPHRKLADDCQTIATWQRKLFQHMTQIQMIDVATYSHDAGNAAAQEAFGVGCLGLSPVLSGIGVVVTG